MRKNFKQAKKNFFLLQEETGTVFKDHGGKLRICLIYPNTYYTGMSNLGFRLVYYYLNLRADVVCERAFLPDGVFKHSDDIDNCALLSLESQRPLSYFDILAFSVSFENDYPNIVKILNMAGVPPRTSNRNTSHYPIVIMGGVCAFMNPEPVCEFFDVVCLGEAEVLLDIFIDTYLASDDKGEFLHSLSQKDGFYIPALFSIEYDNYGTIKRRLNYGEKIQIKKLTADNLNTCGAFNQLVTPHTEFADMHLIELMRGCQWRCRFCAVSSIYGSVRKKDKEYVINEINYVKTKGKRIGLIAPSMTDYPNICELLGQEDVDFSITSLRSTKKAAELISFIRKKTSISIAPEAGSKRLREVIKKNISHEDIIDTARLIFDSSVNTLRLYFIVGLPTETTEDIYEMIALIKEVRELSKKGDIVLSINTFVPKPFTPFQWHNMEDISVVKERLKILKQGLKGVRVKVFHDMPKYAYMQGLFSLGDRRVAAVIEAFALCGDWLRACEEVGVDYQFYVYRKKDFTEALPWDFIANSVEKYNLWNEYVKIKDLKG